MQLITPRPFSTSEECVAKKKSCTWIVASHTGHWLSYCTRFKVQDRELEVRWNKKCGLGSLQLHTPALRRQCFNGIQGPTSTRSKTPGESTRRLTLDTWAELGSETDGRALCFGDGTISRRCRLSSQRQPTLCVAVAQSHFWLQGSTREGKHLASGC